MFVVCLLVVFICFFKQKTAYEMRISDWSSDVCSSDLRSVVIDPGSAEGRAWLRNRIGGADMLITRDGEELAAFGLDGDELLASHPRLILLEMPVYLPGHVPWEIGRASCRERVCQYV